jgi:molybdopterin/thiamine biosynthesis adenylyltransferase
MADVVSELAFRPVFFRWGDPVLRQLLAERPGVMVFDEIRGQLEELVRTKWPQRAFSGEELAAAVDEHLDGTPSEGYGVWVYYPWSRRLVHLLDEDEFAFLRTNRNVYKITPDEYAVLATKKVGIIGLSVGQSIAMTLAMERSVGELRLADFDVLELTNLNRIRTGVHQLNVPKAVLVAREIAELDPYLRTVVFGCGITEDNVDEFFLGGAGGAGGGGRLDAVVDECDGLDVKVLCRQKAREYGVPVIMETSDRGIIDIERFDLERDRPLLHGFLGGLDIDRLKTLRTSEEKLPYILAFAQLDTVSARMKASMVEIRHTISTWPQLASAVALGGALGADVYRRIMLGQLHTSGRWFIDLDELIADPAPAEPANPAPPAEPANPAPPAPGGTPDGVPAPGHTPPRATVAGIGDLDMARAVRELRLTPRDGQVAIGRDTVERLVRAAHSAPSGGNSQPWRWCDAGGTLLLLHDDRLSAGYAQVGANFDHFSHGAALENLVRAAHADGLEIEVEVFPSAEHPRVVAVARCYPPGTPGPELEPHADGDLAGAIASRRTDRRLVPRAEIEPHHLADLVELVQRTGDARLRLVTGDGELDAVAGIVAASDRIRLLNPLAHAEFYQREIRWTPDEAERTGDGVDLATLDLTPAQRTGLHIASDPRVIAHLAEWGGGRAFEELGRKAVASASAVGALVLASFDPRCWIRGGRLTERLWLRATALGLGLQPLTAALMHFHRLDHAGGEHMPAAAQAETRALRQRFDLLFGLGECFGGHGVPMFLFRLIRAHGHAARSHRRPLAEVLHHVD